MMTEREKQIMGGQLGRSKKPEFRITAQDQAILVSNHVGKKKSFMMS